MKCRPPKRPTCPLGARTLASRERQDPKKNKPSPSESTVHGREHQTSLPGAAKRAALIYASPPPDMMRAAHHCLCCEASSAPIRATEPSGGGRHIPGLRMTEQHSSSGQHCDVDTTQQTERKLTNRPNNSRRLHATAVWCSEPCGVR